MLDGGMISNAYNLAIFMYAFVFNFDQIKSRIIGTFDHALQ